MKVSIFPPINTNVNIHIFRIPDLCLVSNYFFYLLISISLLVLLLIFILNMNDGSSAGPSNPSGSTGSDGSNNVNPGGSGPSDNSNGQSDNSGDQQKPRKSSFPESDLFHSYDSCPKDQHNLRIVYEKLKKISLVPENTNPNKGKTMNSNLLQNLNFSDLDRETIKNHITNAYPNHAHRFRYIPYKGYSFIGQMNNDILSLFRP